MRGDDRRCRPPLTALQDGRMRLLCSPITRPVKGELETAKQSIPSPPHVSWKAARLRKACPSRGNRNFAGLGFLIAPAWTTARSATVRLSWSSSI
jgi:hypothetical protein